MEQVDRGWVTPECPPERIETGDEGHGQGGGAAESLSFEMDRELAMCPPLKPGPQLYQGHRKVQGRPTLLCDLGVGFIGASDAHYS